MADEVTNILVVDDLPEKLLSYRTILDELGQNIVEAKSGEDALGALLRDEFAVVLLDVNMPRLNGLETAALIRQRKKSAHTPIIFLTAFADEVRVAEGYAHGAVDYILTPVVPEILRAKVRVFVDLFRMAQRMKRLAEEQTRRAQAEASGRKHRFLAEVSSALADSLDPETTVRTLVRQAVPFLADFASVTLPGDPGSTEKAWRDPRDGEIRTRRLENSAGSRTILAEHIDRAFAGSEAPHHLTNLSVPFPDAAGEKLTSAVLVRLHARNRTLGVLALASGRGFDADALALAEDYASRAAIALDNAMLHHEVQLADKQKNEFLSMLAHELRNPLAPIRNAVEVLRRHDSESPEPRQAREMIGRQVTHLARLVDDLLDISRITRGKIVLKTAVVNVADVLAHAVEASRPFLERGGHQFELVLPGEPVLLRGDPTRLAQVFTNLLNNAAKYTDDGGRIRVAVERRGETAAIRVCDSGVGIPRDMLTRIFDLFTQVDRSLDRSFGGLGIGLTLVRRLVELHGGTVVARSDGPGRGSEFEVRMPTVAAPAVETEPTPMANVATRKLQVLVVDDNVDGAESLAMLLRLSGHDVRVVHNGPAALEEAATFRPDVAVLDIGLPGMDGYALARHLRARPETRNAVLVAVTGYGRDEDRMMSREAGLDHHFVKPLQFEALQRVLAAG